MQDQKITIRDINQWIDNDESLYDCFNQSRKTRQQFIKENKDSLIQYISNILTSKPHQQIAY